MRGVVGAQEACSGYLRIRHVDSPLFAGTELGWGELEMKTGRVKKDQGVIQVGASLVGIRGVAPR